MMASYWSGPVLRVSLVKTCAKNPDTIEVFSLFGCMYRARCRSERELKNH